MKFNIRDAIQRVVIGTSFFPLSLVYGATYSLAVVVATTMLKRVRGVVAIYLRRGAATGEIVFGLSDIDLTVVVDDRDGGGHGAKEAVGAEYRKLSRLIPLFGGAEQEFGAYTASEFAGLYRDYDFHRYRFSEGRRTWKLLFGEDMLATLPETTYPDLCRAAIEELGRWWEYLVEEIVADSRNPRFKSKYLWYKALAAAAQVYLLARFGETVDGRRSALVEVKNHLDGARALLIDAVTGYPRHLCSQEAEDPDALMGLFLHLACEAAAAIDRETCVEGEGKTALLDTRWTQSIAADCGLDAVLRRLETAVGEEYSPHPISATLIPGMWFHPDPLRNSDIDSLCLPLVHGTPVSVEGLRRMHLVSNGTGRVPGIEPSIVIDERCAFSLGAGGQGCSVRSSSNSPWFFAMLRNNGAALGNDQREADGVLRCRLPCSFEETIRRRAAKIDELVSDRDLCRMRSLDFLRFFWAAARTKLVLHSLEADEIRIPLTSGQILEELAGSYPHEAEWFNNLHGEYLKELRQEENEAHRFFPRSVDFMARV